jgi:hypothetical protein
MKNIIGKLGITPAPWSHYKCTQGKDYHAVFVIGGSMSDKIFKEPDARLIATSPEMLMLIIGMVDCAKSKNMVKAAVLLELMEEAVEKATGKKWEEIKELLE